MNTDATSYITSRGGSIISSFTWLQFTISYYADPLMNFGKCEFTMVNNRVLLDGHREQFWDRLHGSALKMNVTFLTKASWRSQHSEL